MEKPPSNVPEEGYLKKIKEKILDTVTSSNEGQRKVKAERKLLDSLGTVNDTDLRKYKDKENEANN